MFHDVEKMFHDVDKIVEYISRAGFLIRPDLRTCLWWYYLCTMRYLIECSYKGTSFHGWQVQNNAPSVQGHIEQALSTVLRKEMQIVGSSRTDAGVHAYQQFAHFDTDAPLNNLEKMVYAMNGILPRDIAIQEIKAVSDEFHSRFDATYRRYLYRISQQKTPFWQDFSYFYRAPLDMEQMNRAEEILKNHIDFQCFSKVHTDVATFNCRIEYANWERQGQFLLFHIKADRFLRGMVRAIVGTMLEVGTGKLSLPGFEDIILSKNRQKAGRSVPAEGLTLVEVGYVGRSDTVTPSLRQTVSRSDTP